MNERNAEEGKHVFGLCREEAKTCALSRLDGL